MTIDVPTVAAPPQAPSFAAAPESADFERRWAAWQAKGAALDRALDHRIALAAPILIIVVSALYAILQR
jgi:hypothetical protein